MHSYDCEQKLRGTKPFLSQVVASEKQISLVPTTQTRQPVEQKLAKFAGLSDSRRTN